MGGSSTRTSQALLIATPFKVHWRIIPPRKLLRACLILVNFTMKPLRALKFIMIALVWFTRLKYREWYRHWTTSSSWSHTTASSSSVCNGLWAVWAVHNADVGAEARYDRTTMFEWQRYTCIHDLPEVSHCSKLLDFLKLWAQASETSTSTEPRKPLTYLEERHTMNM